MTQTLHPGNWLARLVLPCMLAFAATGAHADNESVTHSFADPEIYGGRKAVLYFADEQPPTPVSEEQLMGQLLTLNADIQLEFVYERNWKTLRNDSFPHTMGAMTADTRALAVAGSGIPGHRTQMVFSSPTRATIRRIAFEGRASNIETYFGTYNPGSANTHIILPEEATEEEVVYGSRFSSFNGFEWTGATPTFTIEKSSSAQWFIRSITVEYSIDASKAKTPVITGDEEPFLFSRTVSIGSTDEGAAYYYTTDGTDPTTESTPYTEPFVIDETTTVKAIAVIDGKETSAVASVTFEKLPIREGIADLTAHSTASTVEYIRLTNAVVTWVSDRVSTTGSVVFIQDPSNEKGAGLRLLSAAKEQTLAQGDQVTGILVGVYSALRRDLTDWYFLNDEATVVPGGTAPAADVTLEDVQSLTQENSSSTFFNTDYLSQRVRFTMTVDSVGPALRGFDGILMANPLYFNPDFGNGETGVQVLLPNNDLQFVKGDTYTFTGVLFQFTYIINRTTLFRSLYVESNEDITDAEGRKMGLLDLTTYNQRLLTGDEAQIEVEAQTHEAAMTYASSDESIVTVDGDGKLTALATGSAVITVTLAPSDAYTGVVKDVEVNVFAPTYQVRNSDLAQWEEVRYDGVNALGTAEVHYVGQEPVGWNSYIDLRFGDGQLAAADEGTSAKLTAKVTGTGSASLHLPGFLVTGSYEIPYNEAQTAYAPVNAYAVDNDEVAAEFTGLPDSVAIDVRGFLQAKQGRLAAVLHSPGLITYPYTEGVEPTATIIASAVKADIGPASGTEFETLTLPLEYEVEGVRPAYALISIVTDAIPNRAAAAVAHAAYDTDSLVVRNLRFVYNSELESAVYDGEEIVFDAEGRATVDADFYFDRLEVTPNGRAATYDLSFDREQNTVTITVCGDDIEANPANQHVYVATFNALKTGISRTESSTPSEEVVYNLAGQRVVLPRKGVFIVNGQKRVVR